MNEHWGEEKFEDLVAKGLIAMYESNIKKHKRANKHTLLNEELLNRIRSIGCYFSPSDRVSYHPFDEKDPTILHEIQEIDIINDGRPDQAILCNDHQSHEWAAMYEDKAYLEINYLERISKLPKGFFSNNEGRVYRLVNMWTSSLGFIDGIVQYVSINHEGKIFGTYRLVPNYDPITGRCPFEIIDGSGVSEEEKKLCKNPTTVNASSTIQYYQDRKYLWNVTAKEGYAKATFGVYPEQIKSLFYSRELPMTETGRKRPILHWVASHQRRLKSGYEIDIEKYLRGTNEFIYNGTKFEITRPTKEKK